MENHNLIITLKYASLDQETPDFPPGLFPQDFLRYICRKPAQDYGGLDFINTTYLEPCVFYYGEQNFNGLRFLSELNTQYSTTIFRYHAPHSNLCLPKILFIFETFLIFNPFNAAPVLLFCPHMGTKHFLTCNFFLCILRAN